ncbi:MAG: oligoendopeptidase F [Anaerolineales bacterium]|nr:oligoendopeptidase F [Anaerolineales bacterium]
MSDQIRLPLRSEVPLEETWNLESIFPDITAWETALQQVNAQIPPIAAFEGQLGQGPAQLADFMVASEQAVTLGMQVMVYAMLAQSVDVGDQQAASRAGQARAVMTRLRAATAFTEPELMGIGFDTLFHWTEIEPRLSIYKQYFQELQEQAEHVRSAEVEQVLALASEPLGFSTSNAYSALTNIELPFKAATDEEGKEHEIGQSSIGALITHRDRQVRRTGFENYNDAYLQFKNTLAAIQTQALQRDVFNSRVRHYQSALEASMKPNHIPTEVFHNLIATFQKNLPTWHKYWRIRRAALGFDSFHVYDIKAPLTQTKIEVPFDRAVDWICAGMAPLGKEYVEILRAGCTTNRWVDRALNKGKRQGAFSSGAYDTQPFIMMSYSDDVFSLSTLAHELGHSMHSYYTRRAQPFVYGRYSLFVAEVASNFNQALVRDYLFQTQPDPAFQLALIEEAMSNFHRYFFIMPTLARWELEMHERVEQGAPVNAQIMTERCADLFAEGYGKEVSYERDRIGITWAQFGHMYMNFYVYQYATGISGAHALADRILANEAGAVDRYLEFLSAGSSVYPLDALQRAGVDLTSPAPVEAAFNVLAEIVDRLEVLVEQGLPK